mmetsp:Transcript_42390/g.123135  ORF Transcript_42390/g.123135 Transcript_42390/m.123135 type:complete len:269 (-) Transcript_42390:20-826(-)
MNPSTNLWIPKAFGMLLLTWSTMAFSPHPIPCLRNHQTTTRPLLPPFLATGTTQLSRSSHNHNHHKKTCTPSKTCLHMYNLPPGRKDNDLGDLLKLAGTLILTVAFFVSPLGGIVLGIINSFFLLALLLPIMGGVGIAAWQYLNTMTGDCPNCGAPVRVLKAKDGNTGEPSICFTCGAILQANYDNSGIDNITGRNSLEDLARGGSPLGGGFFDIFGGGAAPTSVSTSTTTTTTTTTVMKEERGNAKSKIRRESTIIDVEVDEDEPWQ